MKSFELKYGCNPNQKPAEIFMENGGDLPIEILNGKPGYINFLDAFNSWQLVSELSRATGLVAAASFKHVSPTSAALGLPMSEKLKKACFVDDANDLDSSPLALAFARARGTDRLCSYGDWIALSDTCDAVTASLIAREVSDGVIAPDFTAEALEILLKKRNGNYNIVKIDKDYIPAEIETKTVFGITFKQKRNDYTVDKNAFSNIVTDNKNLSFEAKRDLTVALITLKYTQSNSVCFAVDGQAIGVGAGQQSRVHCTRLAGNKADTWFLRQSEKVLSLPFKAELSRPQRDNAVDAYINQNEFDICADGVWENYFYKKPSPLTDAEKQEYLNKIDGVSLGSDAFFPFEDNILRAVKSGVKFVAQPGGSIRDNDVIDCCNKFGVTMAFTGMRLFHH